MEESPRFSPLELTTQEVLVALGLPTTLRIKAGVGYAALWAPEWDTAISQDSALHTLKNSDRLYLFTHIPAERHGFDPHPEDSRLYIGDRSLTGYDPEMLYHTANAPQIGRRPLPRTHLRTDAGVQQLFGIIRNEPTEQRFEMHRDDISNALKAVYQGSRT